MPEFTTRHASANNRNAVLELLRNAAVWLNDRHIDYWQNWHTPPKLHLDWIIHLRMS
mgnify:CR=1 FL=1